MLSFEVHHIFIRSHQVLREGVGSGLAGMNDLQTLDCEDCSPRPLTKDLCSQDMQMLQFWSSICPSLDGCRLPCTHLLVKKYDYSCCSLSAVQLGPHGSASITHYGSRQLVIPSSWNGGAKWQHPVHLIT